MKALIGCVGVVGLIALFWLGAPLYLAFSSGFVLAKLWLWYAVPMGVPAIGWKAFGMLGAALYVLRPNMPTFTAGGTDREKQMLAFGYLVSPWVALLIGWILL